jgi:hypothetical protein
MITFIVQELMQCGTDFFITVGLEKITSAYIMQQYVTPLSSTISCEGDGLASEGDELAYGSSRPPLVDHLHLTYFVRTVEPQSVDVKQVCIAPRGFSHLAVHNIDETEVAVCHLVVLVHRALAEILDIRGAGVRDRFPFLTGRCSGRDNSAKNSSAGKEE